MQYGAIMADPAWRFAVRSPKGEGRSASQHYATMTIEEIKTIPVADMAAPDCALFLWVIDTMIPDGLEVIKAWGFQFKTVGFNWGKLNRDGSPFMGTGYWTRANPELCFLATRGHPKRLDRGVRRLILAQRREHSRKPDDAYAGVQRLVSGPYLDMFSREKRSGWDQWGSEPDKFARAP